MMIGTGRALLGARQFSPSDLPGLALLLDAGRPVFQDTARTIPAVAADDPVGGWPDASGRGHHGQQATASKRYTLKLGAFPSGKPGLLGDGVDDHFSTVDAVPFTSGAVSLYVVAKRNWTSAAYVGFLSTDNYAGTAGIAWTACMGSTSGTNWSAGDSVLVGNGFNDGQSPQGRGPNTSPTDGTTHVFSAVLSASQAKIWRDGVLISTSSDVGSAVPSTTHTLFVGSTFAGSITDPFDGHLGLVIAYDAEHSAVQRKMVERWGGGWAGVAVA